MIHRPTLWFRGGLVLEAHRLLYHSMQARATATARAFDSQQVTHLVDALAKMGVEPDAGLVAAMKARATGGKIVNPKP